MTCDRILTMAPSDKAPIPRLTRPRNPPGRTDSSTLSSPSNPGGSPTGTPSPGKEVPTEPDTIIVARPFPGTIPENLYPGLGKGRWYHPGVSFSNNQAETIPAVNYDSRRASRSSTKLDRRNPARWRVLL